MLDKQHGKFVVEYDKCSETLETQAASFEAAKAVWEAEEWTSRPLKGEWQHYCANCSRDH